METNWDKNKECLLYAMLLFCTHYRTAIQSVAEQVPHGRE